MDFSSMKELTDFLQGVIDDELKYSIAEEVKDSLVNAAQNLVYDVYSPNQYNRRYSYTDRENIVVDDSMPGTVEISYNVQFNDDYPSSNSGDGLTGLIEFGDGWEGHYYDYIPQDKEPTFMYPRPFIAPVREQLKDTLKDDMRQALRNAGLNVT